MMELKNSVDYTLAKKPRILVCAPSNAAVDEILNRISECGLLDGQLNRYNPDIIRLGGLRNLSDSQMSLDNLIKSYTSLNQSISIDILIYFLFR